MERNKLAMENTEIWTDKECKEISQFRQDDFSLKKKYSGAPTLFRK